MMRVLHVYPQLNCGGTEMVFYNLIKFGNRADHSYEILIQCHGDNESIFTEINVPIHCIPFTSREAYYNDLVVFFKKENYDVVHAHTNKNVPIVLKAAKDAGIKCRVAHSHTARVDIPRILWPLCYFRHRPYEKYSTLLFGCSQLALKWLFPKKWRKGKIINNGIDLDSFGFDYTIRQKIRNENAISESTKVFINVGRCANSKNQQFILELAKERIDKDEIYVIIGDGPLFESLKSFKETNNLPNVLLLGKRNDVAQWLCAADFFLFPSIYEGLGIVAVEAEASGLIVLATDTIPVEADMGMGNFHRISLSDKSQWHKLMSQSAPTPEQRESLSKKANASSYNIHAVTKHVESLYRINQ